MAKKRQTVKKNPVKPESLLSNEKKTSLLLSGVFFANAIIYGLLTYVVYDGVVRLAGEGITYVISTPVTLTLFYAFVTVFSIALAVKLFQNVEEINFRSFLKIVFLVPHLTISTDPEGHRLYIATTFLFIGLAILSIVPLVATPAFPPSSAFVFFIVGSMFSAMAILNINRLLR
ncbi:MAG: hypothetical protein JXA43_02495 [Candidatus Diapherotrites archaeon]|nr:hypothetical protein [Candidatus Diapherotrites archaeon]